MCGIVGFGPGNLEGRETIVRSMMESIAYRGPDDSGVALDTEWTFGHVRLAIIDAPHAKQPMKSQDGRFTLVFNGEIYNYLELRQELVQAGVAFRTYSDTEVLLQLLMRYGEKCLGMLNGMFAFAFYDRQEKKLLLARDHFGVKPLYYTQVDGTCIFASEIKALLRYPGVRPEADSEALAEYLTFQFNLGERTFFKDISQLQPAHFLTIQNGVVQPPRPFWNPGHIPDESKSAEQYAGELLVLLENSLSMQTRSDVPVGSYLSGGLDSSTVAVLAAKNYTGKIKTFSGYFDGGEAYDESRFSQMVSEVIGSDHYKVKPGPEDFARSFEGLIYHMDYPEAGPGLFSQYMVSRLAREHVKVVLGGQGGDEIFGGYARYAVAYLEQCLKGAIFETQEEGKHVVTLASITQNLPQLQQYVPMIREQFRSGLFDSMERRYFQLVSRNSKLDRVYQGEFLESLDFSKTWEGFEAIFLRPRTFSYFNKMTKFDQQTLLPALLHVEDRVSMAVSLESRVPLLDYRILELAMKIPPVLKFAGGKSKAMLIEAVKNILPRPVVERTDKMGFPTPINQWLTGPLKSFALDILTSQKARERGMLKVSEIERSIMDEGAFNRNLWGALCLEMWHRIYIDEGGQNCSPLS